MRISESRIRQIIREETRRVLREFGDDLEGETDDDSADESKGGLWANIRARRKAGKRPHRPGEKGYPKTLDIEENLSEGVRNTHGYRVTRLSDVRWTPDKASIPAARNPFVGSSPAFNSWFNDGQMKKGFTRTIAKDTPDERHAWMSMDVLIEPGDHVIIPHLDGIEPEMTKPGEIMSIKHLAADNVVRDAGRVSFIPLVNVRWKFGDKSHIIENIGLAFLYRVAGKKGYNAVEQAREAMDRHRESSPSEPAVSDEPPRSGPERVIRRVGGVAAPTERKPQIMSGDEIRRSLGLSKR
jgi:hypothetical protein